MDLFDHIGSWCTEPARARSGPWSSIKAPRRGARLLIYLSNTQWSKIGFWLGVRMRNGFAKMRKKMQTMSIIRKKKKHDR